MNSIAIVERLTDSEEHACESAVPPVAFAAAEAIQNMHSAILGLLTKLHDLGVTNHPSIDLALDAIAPLEVATDITYGAGEEFVTCPKCCSRTSFTEVIGEIYSMPHAADGIQLHRCIRDTCKHVFLTEPDEDLDEDDSDE